MIRSKAQVTVDEMGDNYVLLGPLNEHCVRTEVEKMEPDTERLRKTIESMRNHGINVKKYFTRAEQCYYIIVLLLINI